MLGKNETSRPQDKNASSKLPDSVEGKIKRVAIKNENNEQSVQAWGWEAPW